MFTITGLKFEIELSIWLGLITLVATIAYMLFAKSREEGEK
jgi:hypothetical protein